ncbi:carbon-nitrogen hydrolase family protein [Streptomyces sp. NPDC001663]|uniref:carbon-nitrogen hydrolase family protein n=1 Tax=Streptomyces sp. NPDC001663 TaxID=3364597 RepID=UPI0036B51468
MGSTVTVAAAHLEPVLLNKWDTVRKTIDAIGEAAGNGARLIAFPESFIPGFPIWTALHAPIHNHDLFAAFIENSIYIDGPEIEEIRQAARRHDILVSVGFSERNPASLGSIWNSNVLVGPDGTILNHHRKIVPTFYEKLVWTPGDGHGLRVVPTPLGRLGALICGENTNPLAGYTLMAEAEQVHISTYPPLWPTRDPGSAGKNYDLENAIRIRAGAHSFEAKVFNVVVSSVFGAQSARTLSTLGEEAARIAEESARGVSLVLDPFGDVISDVMREEGLLYCAFDPDGILEPKQFHDLSGSYNRFDIFDLRVNRRRVEPISFSPSASAEGPGSAASTARSHAGPATTPHGASAEPLVELRLR